MLLIGYDIGSSSVKASLVDAADGTVLAKTQYPQTEMAIDAPKAGWAEQAPASWWTNLCQATKALLQESQADKEDIKAIGISYQMHGLVVVDKDNQVLRPSIIWCDSRAVSIGDQAFKSLGETYCLEHYLNSPGNFTASKMRWVIQNEPSVSAKADAIMLPGDYIALKMTGERSTTISGLSEGVLWDFKEQGLATELLNHYGIDRELIPEIRPTFSNQGTLHQAAAAELGLRIGTPVTYRAGDQPNNALCLNVLHPGQVAATGGTSGVVYGVVDRPVFDPASRVNGFAHVNYTKQTPNVGVLLCINGAGIQYNWLRQQVAQNQFSYPEMEQMAAKIPVGAAGLSILPFGNGAERVLENKDIGARICNLQFNRHETAHLIRAGLEGIAFSFVYGLQIMRKMGISINHLRVGNDNLFQSAIFSNTIATLTGVEIEVVETTGAIGAAKAAGVAVGAFDHLEEALGNTETVNMFGPEANKDVYESAYQRWEAQLKQAIL
ncbi:MAG: FGGY-family carbohydrate kinase [Saprospiraceae bacterium]